MLTYADVSSEPPLGLAPGVCGARELVALRVRAPALVPHELGLRRDAPCYRPQLRRPRDLSSCRGRGARGGVTGVGEGVSRSGGEGVGGGGEEIMDDKVDLGINYLVPSYLEMLSAQQQLLSVGPR